MATVGVGFPFRFKDYGSGVISASSSEPNFVKIIQAIELILLTPLGTRFFMPQFGSRLHLMPYELNDTVTENMLRVIIREAIEAWEDRVNVLSIDMSAESDYVDQGLMVARIRIMVKEDQSVGSFDYVIRES